MNYVSTRNRNIALTASQAISQGLARGPAQAHP